MKTNLFTESISDNENLQKLQAGAVIIKEAASKAELEDIFSLRYKIYVERMNLKEKNADHFKKRIVEPLDLGAINVGAWVGERIVACIRINLSSISDLRFYADRWSMNMIADFSPDRFCICSRLMIDESYRNSRLNVQLQQFCFKIALLHGIRHCFIESRDNTLKYYHRFGFRSYKDPINHEIYGELTPLCLDLSDIDYLQSIRSPFIEVYNNFKLRFKPTFTRPVFMRIFETPSLLMGNRVLSPACQV